MVNKDDYYPKTTPVCKLTKVLCWFWPVATGPGGQPPHLFFAPQNVVDYVFFFMSLGNEPLGPNTVLL